MGRGWMGKVKAYVILYLSMCPLLVNHLSSLTRMITVYFLYQFVLMKVYFQFCRSNFIFFVCTCIHDLFCILHPGDSRKINNKIDRVYHPRDPISCKTGFLYHGLITSIYLSK